MANRRAFLGGMLAAGFMPARTWADVGNPAFLSAGAKADGTYVLCGLRADGQISFARDLPARGHAAAAHPRLAEAVAFARRPGTFALLIACATGRVKVRLEAPAGRHFCGHGAYSADGDLLFTTENDFDAARGVVGIWDARRGYGRLGEFASGGIGPHDIKLMPDGQTLVIANGGIETHPDTGRTKLNLPTMRPNLSYVALDGRPVAQVELDAPLRKNSIRHLAVGADGSVAFAMQWQGDLFAGVPLLGLHRAMTDAAPDLADAADFDRMQGYVGSVAMQRDRVAVTSPRGGLVLEFDRSDLALKRRVQMADVCGVAAAGAGFVATSGTGVVTLSVGVRTGLRHPVRWDNHLIAI